MKKANDETLTRLRLSAAGGRFTDGTNCWSQASRQRVTPSGAVEYPAARGVWTLRGTTVVLRVRGLLRPSPRIPGAFAAFYAQSRRRKRIECTSRHLFALLVI